MIGRLGAAALLAVGLAGCGESAETARENGYDEGYANGYAEADAEASERIAELEAIIEEAQSAISDARSAVSRSQDTAANAASEADGFRYRDWRYVVGDVQGATNDAESYAQDANDSLDRLEEALSGY
jgi:hypothetical protein